MDWSISGASTVLGRFHSQVVLLKEPCLKLPLILREALPCNPLLRNAPFLKPKLSRHP
ncbi:hypothetical protein HAX54_021109, partial [Datura stramonium]|nr:hypothetical protein [Datura stramonium]